jgi:hypothetical protein
MKDKCTSVKLALMAAALLALVGCSADARYSDLDREPTAADTVPADLPKNALDPYVVNTVRFVGVVDQKQLFLGKAKGKDQALCLLIYSDATDWGNSCGPEMMTSGSGDFQVMIVSDAMPDKDGWTRASNNILVKDR